MKYMKVLVHQQPYKEILRSFGLEKLFSLRWSPSSWFLLGLICLWIATLEVVLPNHTWNMIMSSKPCFVIIKIKINQTLVSYNLYIAVNLQTYGHINVVGAFKDRSDIYFNLLLQIKLRYLCQEIWSNCFESYPSLA